MQGSVKNSVLQSTDIVEVVGEHVRLQRRGKDFVGLCPFHADRKPSLHVSPSLQIFKCFACGAGGNVIKFVQMHERMDYREALTALARRAGISLTDTEADRRADQIREQIRQALVWASNHFKHNLNETPGGQAALEYALRRGLTREIVAEHGLGYAADAWDDLLRAAERAGLGRELLQQAGLIVTNETGKTYDRFRHRLIFPIADRYGRAIAFGGRTLGDDPAKYLNSPETGLFSKSRVLFGLDRARRSIEQHGQTIVVEGYLDVVLLHQFGFTNAVATLGTALTDTHVKLLKRFADTLVLCFDGDQAGVRAADRAVEVSLQGGVDIRVVVLEAGMDPADCVVRHGADDFERALQTAVDALQFKWSLVVGASGDGGPGMNRAAISNLLEFVAGVMSRGGANPLEQGMLVRRLSGLLELPADAVYEMLSAARRASRPATVYRPTVDEELVRSETSGYVAAIRGLPAGLVAAVEDLFGLLLADARCTQWIDNHFVESVGLCEIWKRLYAVLQHLVEEQGGYTKDQVIERCEDDELCELVARACAQVRGTAAIEEAFLSARAKLASERGVQRRGELRQHLGQAAAGATGDARAFGDLLALARESKEEFVLPTDTRWNPAGSS